MIPNIFYQSWDDDLPDEIRNKNNVFIKGYEYKLFTIEDMQQYLKEKGDQYLYLFNKYKRICHKVDLWRYCILYDTGGVYMDADCILYKNIDFFKNRHSVFVTNNRGAKDFFNGFIMTVPKNPILKTMIDYLLKVDTSLEHDYYFNCKELYNITSKILKIRHFNRNDYGNVTILIDRHVNNTFYPFYKNIPILAEMNYKYPYEQKKGWHHVWIGDSDTPSKTIQLPQLPNMGEFCLNEHTFSDKFQIIQTKISLIITRTDENSGWGHPHSGYIKWFK